ncbi:MAG: hypothetical protein ABGW78_06290, partial [Pirellulales bacterium]
FRNPEAEKAFQEQKQKNEEYLSSLYNKLDVAKKREDAGAVKQIKKAIAARESTLKASLKKDDYFDGTVQDWVAQNESQVTDMINDAYLRTLVRRPTEQELARSITYLKQSPTAKDGLRDILWALLNTKEFALNH